MCILKKIIFFAISKIKLITVFFKKRRKMQNSSRIIISRFCPLRMQNNTSPQSASSINRKYKNSREKICDWRMLRSTHTRTRARTV